MRKNKMIRTIVALAAVVVCAAGIFTSTASAQRRDYLTDAEVELVRDAQQIDLRIAVLMIAVDRRLAAIDGTKSPIKDETKWGPVPEGTRLDLVRDIDGLTQKAVDDIDDVASRNADSEFFPKAVFKFAGSCEALTTKLKTLFESSKDEKERGAITRTADRCKDVIEAASRLPKDTKNAPKKKS